MFQWINALFGVSEYDDATPPVDQTLLIALAKELEACEELYRRAVRNCLLHDPSQIECDPDKFLDLMIDLHRGLMVKTFIELAGAGRLWNPPEREMALVLLQHVWGVRVARPDLTKVLRTVADHANMLQWESMLKPFRELTSFREEAPELEAHTMRIANLIAKADGRILPAEEQALKSIQANLRQRLQPSVHQGVQPLSGNIARTGQQVAQAVSVRQVDAPPPEKEPEIDPAQLLEEAMTELQKLIGLESVKKDISQLVNFLKVQAARSEHQLATPNIALHTVFCGNPGTGKTTVARIIGKVLRGLEILQKGHTVETDRSGLVAEFAGQTGPKVNKVVDESLDGLLFIDEAYSLIAEEGDDPFGAEALQALLKRVEDDRERLIVVLAGYPAPMQRMLRSNPGLSSRFQRLVDFPDYSPDELLEIFTRMCADQEYTLSDAARKKLHAGFEQAVEQRDEHFGNARLARNIFEKAIRRQADRIVGIAPITRQLLSLLEADDIEFESKRSQAESRLIV